MAVKRAPASLATYAKKRDFAKTPEPSDAPGGAPSRGERLRFVVQMHSASRLHYDFRLEADGVLKSWAVPKGPSFDTHEKRLAMAVEDHPLDYRSFEGIIPAGNYGAGEVIVWDRGTYRLTEGTSLTEQIERGSVKIEMSGEKLHGAFALVHIKGRGGEANAWLLIKERDEFVDPSWRIEDHARSVVSDRTLADIARDPSAPHWKSNRTTTAVSAASPKARAKSEATLADLDAESKPRERGPRTPRASRAKTIVLPEVEGPMLASAVEGPFDDPAWCFELKWDGYRGLARIEADGSVAIASRNGKDFTTKFPELAALGTAFAKRPLIVDGEIVVLDADGKPSFAELQARLDRFGREKPQNRPVTFVAFDLLFGDGRDLRDEPLVARKAALEALLTGDGPVMLSKHVVRDGTQLYELAKSRDLEGIVGKRLASRYVSKRSRDWVKIKAQLRQEVVIAGWTAARGSRKHFGALLAGVYEGDDLVFAGSVGSGFDAKKLAAIAAELAPLERKTAAFREPPKTETKAHWTQPSLVAEVSFTEWTRDGSMRHPVFIALRADKDPREVVRERATRR